MFTRLANYLLGGAPEAVEDEAQEQVVAAAAATTTRKDEFPPGIPMEARLRQVTVEGDDWILVDRYSMDESWYVTPPACFTQPGPVHVETSPLEDLLIEHPSMSVYRSAGQDSPNDPASVGNGSAAVVFLGKHGRNKASAKGKASGKAPRTPLARRNVDSAGNVVANGNSNQPGGGLVVKSPAAVTVANDDKRGNNNNNNHSNNSNNNHQQQPQGGGVVQEMPRRTAIREFRSSRNDENMRIQIRSAQKIMEKRSSSASKRNILERGNKVRDAGTGKGKRPRRQDRLRLNNSNANNNRKC